MSFRWSPTAGLAAVLTTNLFPLAGIAAAEYLVPPDELLGAGYEAGEHCVVRDRAPRGRPGWLL